MIKRAGSLFVALSITVFAGCGSGRTEPAKATPELTPEAKGSMEKAVGGGGGPEMIRQMEEKGKTKPE